ncbi:enoyl-CoA hydratase/isomerase family protein [Mesorhizobium argentiipisi]|uniref:Enoyl-CoA hydratase/isomerase family protein n=1 Tax=Mesorhizobium argentiipisi TaxID=3015175 RepID=A0ABU8K674_9HYPH
MSHLTCTIDNRVATITLDNAPQNRIGDQMVEELAAAIAQIANSDARAVLLRGAGPDFSFGGDIRLWPDRSRSALRGTFERYMEVFNRFEQLPLPVVAAVNGLCFGGGLELALRADVLFASDTARFGHPEQTLGIVTLLGGIYRVAERAGRARAAEWALTSEQIPASVMERAGIVNRVVADDELLAQAQAFVDKLAKGPTRAFAAHKALLRAWANGGVAAADEIMFDIAMPVFDSQDATGGIASAVDALKAGKPRPSFPFKGA